MDNLNKNVQLQFENNELSYKNKCLRTMIDFLLNELKEKYDERPNLKP